MKGEEVAKKKAQEDQPVRSVIGAVWWDLGTWLIIGREIPQVASNLFFQ
jgi:hypothetical protein